MSNEQWLRSGTCEKCRKKNYCHAPCKANLRRSSFVTTTLFTAHAASILNGKPDKDVTDKAIDALTSRDRDGKFLM